MKTLTQADMRALGQIEHLSPDLQDRFDDLLNKGNSPSAALMFTCRQPPGVRGGDRVFNEQAHRRMSTMNKMNLEGILAIAKRAGISTQGKYYCGGLGKYSDPGAWVSCADDVLAVAKERDYTVTGTVNHQGTDDLPPPTPVPLAEDLLQGYEQQYAKDPKTQEKLKKNPTKARRELREKIIANHGYRTPK